MRYTFEFTYRMKVLPVVHFSRMLFNVNAQHLNRLISTLAMIKVDSFVKRNKDF